jgi:hypothetical protein
MLNNINYKYILGAGLVVSLVTGGFLLKGKLDSSASHTIIVNGQGDTEDSSLANAKKNAISQACGEVIFGITKAQTETQKNTSLNSSGENSKSFTSDEKNTDDNLSLVGGSIKSFTLKNKGQQNGFYFAEIEAVVVDCKKSDEVTNALTGGDKDGLISNPKNLSQKYNNARVLGQRGEVDKALKVYEQLLKEKMIYADPITDMVLLAKKAYGPEGSKKYIQNAFAPIKNRPEYFFALNEVSDKPVVGSWDMVVKSTDSFTPLIVSHLNNHEKYCIERFPPEKDRLGDMKFANCRNEILKLEKIETIIKKLETKIKSREFDNFFLDSYKAKDYSETMWNSTYLSTLGRSQPDMKQVQDAMSQVQGILNNQKNFQNQQSKNVDDAKNKYPNLGK